MLQGILRARACVGAHTRSHYRSRRGTDGSATSTADRRAETSAKSCAQNAFPDSGVICRLGAAGNALTCESFAHRLVSLECLK
jgi:hypothetical protein